MYCFYNYNTNKYVRACFLLLLLYFEAIKMLQFSNMRTIPSSKLYIFNTLGVKVKNYSIFLTIGKNNKKN